MSDEQRALWQHTAESLAEGRDMQSFVGDALHHFGKQIETVESIRIAMTVTDRVSGTSASSFRVFDLTSLKSWDMVCRELPGGTGMQELVTDVLCSFGKQGGSPCVSV